MTVESYNEGQFVDESFFQTNSQNVKNNVYLHTDKSAKPLRDHLQNVISLLLVSHQPRF